MKQLLPLCFAATFLFSSCAAIFNSRNMTVKVSSAHPCYLVNHPSFKEVRTYEGYKSYFRDDLIPVKPHHPIVLTVPRDKDPLRMEFVKDSLRTLVEVRSKLSWVYWLNFAAVYPFPGIGFIGDIGTSKKWEYQNDIFVDIEHPQYTFTRHSSSEKISEYQEPNKVIFEKDAPKVIFEKDSPKHAQKKSGASE